MIHVFELIEIVKSDGVKILIKTIVKENSGGFRGQQCQTMERAINNRPPRQYKIKEKSIKFHEWHKFLESIVKYK